MLKNIIRNMSTALIATIVPEAGLFALLETAADFTALQALLIND